MATAVRGPGAGVVRTHVIVGWPDEVRAALDRAHADGRLVGVDEVSRLADRQVQVSAQHQIRSDRSPVIARYLFLNLFGRSFAPDRTGSSDCCFEAPYLQWLRICACSTCTCTFRCPFSSSRVYLPEVCEVTRWSAPGPKVFRS